MKKVRPWLNPLAMVAIATMSWSSPTIATEANPTTTAYGSPNFDPIPIQVPPPERGNVDVNHGICRTDLRAEIDSVLQKSNSKWAILVEPLNGGEPLYYYNADLRLIPASNMKILTTAAALQKLDPTSSIGSKSLREWVQVTNLRSNNYYADTLLRHLGGAGAVRQALSQLGVDPNSYRIADGSGLSRANLASPRALVQTLRSMYYATNHEIFLASLPTAGETGTLRNRMRQTPAQGMVHAKTGTLTGVRALSGYIEHPQYGTLVFSILGNQPNRSGTSLVKTIDEIVVKLTQLNYCS